MLAADAHDETDLDGLIQEDASQLLFRVHRTAFTSQEIFDAEIEKFWLRSWLYLGHASEVPTAGDYLTRTLAGRPLIFVRDEQGDLRAYLNACPHRGTTVCREEKGHGRFFTCFYHAWSFRTTGELVSLPDEEAYEGCDLKARYSLREVPRLENYRGFVFVSFDEEIVDLRTYLGDATENLDFIADQSPNGVEVVSGTHRYTSRTNWKLAVENALDGYHFLPTHATFVEFRKDSGWVVDPAGQWRSYGSGRHVVVEAKGFYGRSGLTWEPAWGEAERERIDAVRAELRERLGTERGRQLAEWSRNTFLFPNLLCFDFIGVSIRVLEPVAPDRTEIRAWTLAPVGEPPDARELRLRNMIAFVGPGGLATPDDIEAQQCAQEGYRATAVDVRRDVAWNDVSRGMKREVEGVETGIYDEGHLRAFWRHWAEELAR